MRHVDRIVEPLCALLLLAIVLVLFVGVLFRYAFNLPLGWTEEIARFGLVWMTFLGAYLAFRRGIHMHIDLAVAKMSARARSRLHVVGNLLMAVLIAILIRAGVQYAGEFFGDPSPYLRFPIGLQYVALPLAGILWLLALAVRTKAAVTQAPEDEPTAASRPVADSE
ncbi:MAG: TRAP transporter small permease [Chloroflexi bacterium]|nr:TRAP transporter small permease [Chloroflexota bacterium]